MVVQLFIYSTSNMEKSSFVLTILLFFVQKVSGQNCTTLFSTCKAIIEAGQERSITSSPKLDTNKCNSMDSLEKLCSSYKSFWLCVNTTLANCLIDQTIRKELEPLQFAYNGYCTQEVICGNRIGKCYCEAGLVSDITNFTKMCNNEQQLTQCIGKIKDCDHVATRQQATIFITMMEAICKTACPDAFKCFIGSKGQSRSRFGPSENPAVITNICSDLLPRFKCLTNNTRTCSASLSDKWQRVVTSHEEVCSEFDKYMTDPSPCEKIQTCVDKAEAVPGVKLGDWKNNTALFFTHTKEVTTAMLNPGTWCSTLTHAVGCVDQEADICNVTMKEKELVASMKISVGNTCNGTDISNETETHTSGFERLSSFAVMSFLMAAAALL